jgi:hypothetical protein
VKGLFSSHQRAAQEFRRHLRSHWTECVCASCGDVFYKKPSKSDNTCGSFDCEGGYRFLTSKPPRRTYLTPLRISQMYVAFFKAGPYTESGAVPLIGHGANHVFTGTAGQICDDALFRGKKYDATPYFLAQPVVRMQPSTQDGFLKSFINISLERLDSRAIDHLRGFEDYLHFLSHLGVYVGDLRLKVYEDRPNWGTGEFRSAVIGVYHDGLEIGVLNYFTDIPQTGRSALTMSDISFGLERVAWSLNRSHRFVDMIGPAMELTRSTPHDLLDAYRTNVLLMLSGVKSERRTEAGSKLRSLFLSSMCPTTPIRMDLIEYYYQWWAHFTKPTVTCNLLVDRWRNQLARQLEEKLGVQSRAARSPEEVVIELTTKGIISSRDLRGTLDAR